ncbi:MAG: efflux RND transporter periplasmic adaptor subunit, partial [Gemmataceae bacterium]
DRSLTVAAPKLPLPSESEGEDRSLTVAAPNEPKPSRGRRWLLVLAVVVILAGLAVAVPALGTPAIQRFLNPPAIPVAAPILESHAQLLPDSDEMELPPDVAERLGVRSEPVQTDVTSRSLELAGSLAFNPNRLGRVQARFAGEVVALGTLNGHLSSEYPKEQPLRYGSPVTAGQVLAVVLSKDLGEKKSELVDALVRLWYDEAQLPKYEGLVKQGSVPPVTVMNQRTVVATDRNAVFRVGLTLKTWRVPAKEIDAVKKEANRVYTRQSERDLEKETEWAKVEVRAPFDGTIVEKNVSLHSIVHTDFDLFKVADLRELGVVVHAYEEDLGELRQLPRGFPWKLRAAANPNGPLLKSGGVQQLGLIVDPAQHTDPVMGLVSNNKGSLRVGQFVKATVDLPPPPNVVSVPASALVEDGEDSIVFVQPDPSKPRYARRRVAVAMRLRDAIYVRTDLSEKERKKGLQAVKPGEFIVTEGSLELQSALEDLQARAKAQK